ncbi:hypothetical protein D9Q98_008089 [Chlorella vulgaris]|uniref:Barstar (barnase inhibitor) domain-containing protein n=1 Tax=Chlorella vulgaris TaxID=3077 RepID=A0A9D4TFZ2_CHLVU|nr:hypothetical protein D9Q98_008089 [Chlorella vulgaris]
MTKKKAKPGSATVCPATSVIAAPGALVDGELVVELRGRILSRDDFWAAMSTACALPHWFGRNLDAWRDTLRGGISSALDAQPLVVRADAVGIFAPCERYGREIESIFASAAPRARLELSQPPRRAHRQAGS